MAINLGAAYVDIVPSTRGLVPQLQQQVIQPVSAAGDAAGAGFGSRFASGVSSFLGGVGQVLEKTLSAAAVAGAGLATITFAKGWDRLTTIQDATAALTISLGSASDAAALLDEVLAVVKGTPFNFDQFAQAAQQMVGFGIDAQKVPGYLTAIGEASATQGKRAGEFAAQLSNVFAQIAAKGTVQLQDVWRISETGVNALAILANHFGLTTDSMRKMISDGSVPAGEALDALAAGILNGSDGPAGATIALAGTMQLLRQQLSGLVGGIGAATARLGAALLAPFTPALTEAFGGVIDFLDKITPKAQAFSQTIVNSAGFQSFMGWLRGLPDAISGAVGAVQGLGDLLGPVLGLLASFASNGLAGIPIIGQFIPVIGPFVGIIAGLIGQSPELRAALGDLLDSLGRLGSALVTAFTPVIEKVLPVIETVLGLGLEGLTSAVDFVTGIVDAFNTSGIGGVWDKLSADWASAGPNVTSALDTLWTSVSGWVSQKVTDAPTLIGGLADAITSGFDTALNGSGDTPPLLDSLETAWGLVDSSTQQQQADLEENVRTTWPKAFTSWVDSVVNGDENGPGIVDRMQTITDSIDKWIDNGGIQQLLSDGAKLAGALLKGFITVVLPGVIQVVNGLVIAFAKAIGSILWMFVQLGASIAEQIVKGIGDFLTDKLPGVIGQAAKAAFDTSPLGGFGLVSGPIHDLLKADGGPVFGSQPYIVGERGPEWFVPKTDGNIIPNHTLRSWAAPAPAAGSSSGGGSSTHMENHFHSVNASARDLTDEQGWLLRVAG